MAASLDLSTTSSINGTCFNGTNDEAYDDLRALQHAASNKVREVSRLYAELKDLEDDNPDQVDVLMRKETYNELREGAIDAVREWYVKTGETIRESLERDRCLR